MIGISGQVSAIICRSGTLCDWNEELAATSGPNSLQAQSRIVLGDASSNRVLIESLSSSVRLSTCIEKPRIDCGNIEVHFIEPATL
jgi:hypothetical protein